MFAGDDLWQGRVKSLHPEPIEADFGNFRVELSSGCRENFDARNALNSALASHGINEPENGAPRHGRPSVSLFQVSKSRRTNEFRCRPKIGLVEQWWQAISTATRDQCMDYDTEAPKRRNGTMRPMEQAYSGYREGRRAPHKDVRRNTSLSRLFSASREFRRWRFRPLIAFD